MTRSKRNSRHRSSAHLSLFPALAVVLLILCVSARAEDQYGPQPKPPKVSAAATAPDPAPQLRLVEIFSVEQNPGAGTLEYQSGKDAPEKIVFGAGSGIYALAMAFNGNSLPDQYGKNFKKDTIIQMALGTLKSKLEGQVPQFSAATLIGPGLPTSNARYPVIVPQEGKSNLLKTMALVLFTLPNTPNELNDEQKLRTTFFAQSGYLELQMNGAAKVVDVQAQGKNLRFKMYPLEMAVNVTLGTPFSAQAATLKGKIQFPLYTPHGKPAQEFTQRIAGESLEGTIKPAGRDVASPRK